MIEFSKVRINHIHWSEQVIQALKKGELPVIDSFRDCEFGKWLHTDGWGNYGEIKEIAELEQKHKEFHKTAEEMVKFMKLKDFDKAEILLREFRRESKDLVFLLSLVEYRLHK